ncbi:hypothetical protein ACXR6G_18405 [Ancylomarina sp. YFZ004]
MKADKVIQVLNSKCNRNEPICELLIEIISLREKLKQPDKQSFYFKRGITQQRKRFVELKGEYESLKNHINKNKLGDLRVSLENQKKYLKKWKAKREIHITDMIAISALQRGIVFRENIIRAKKKYNRLHALEYYLLNPESLVVFFDV